MAGQSGTRKDIAIRPDIQKEWLSQRALRADFKLLTGPGRWFILRPKRQEVGGKMEDKDLQLIRRLIPGNAALKKLWDEHLDYEHKLEEFNKKRYLSAEDEMRRRKIQKLKLAGKDQIEAILRQHRQ